jgi:hypothetical protein
VSTTSTEGEIVPYTREKPSTTPGSDELKRRVPGWGVDLEPSDRPSVPKERPIETGAHWDFPIRQTAMAFREKSTEHQYLTPVFGTAQPLHGLSGLIRRYAYTFSEGRTAHWLWLIIGDRVDILGSRVSAVLRGEPDNPVAETGVLSELKDNAYRTRFGQHRADLKHQPLDLVLWAAPYVALGGAIYLGAKALSRR